MAKETILNRAGSSAIDCILPFASKCAIGVSTYCRKFPMEKIEEPKVTPERLMQFGFAYAQPLIISAAVANKVFDTLARGAKNIEEERRQTGASVRSMSDILI